MKKLDLIINNLSKQINEGILDPVQKELNPRIFLNKKMKSQVKKILVNKITNWCEKRDIKILSMFLVGSNTGYSYTDFSDIDIEVKVNLTNSQIKKIWSQLPNGESLTNSKHPIEYYLRSDGPPSKERGPAYNILEDSWLREPEKENPFSNYRSVAEISRFFILGIDASISEYEIDTAGYEKYKTYLNTETNKKEILKQMEQKLFEIIADIDTLFIAKHIIKSLRKEAFEQQDGLRIKTEITTKDANTSVNNLIYKYINDLNYIDKIDKIILKQDYWKKEQKMFLSKKQKEIK